MGRPADPWDQLPNESDQQYSHFLVYRNLGMSRTIIKAYVKAHPEVADENRTMSSLSSAWRNESTRFKWFARATAWDIQRLLTAGGRATAWYMAGLKNVAREFYRATTKYKVGDPQWKDVLATLDKIGPRFDMISSRPVEVPDDGEDDGDVPPEGPAALPPHNPDGQEVGQYPPEPDDGIT